MSRRDQIAEALRNNDGIGMDIRCGRLDAYEVADALLPTVDRLCAEAAAEALKATAEEWRWNAPVFEFLTARAAAVNPSKEQQP